MTIASLIFFNPYAIPMAILLKLVFNSSSHDDTQENRTVEAVWQSDICHICCIDFGDIIACLLQSLRYSDGYTTETGQYSDNPLSVYDLHQEDGNILLPQSWYQQERVLLHSIRG
mgnify:CR=1 FL=1